jgi:hypothetical protein
MRWLRQHSDGGRIFVVARVSAEGAGYVLTLIGYERGALAETIAGSYSSRDIAFTAADALVRSRHGAHTCGPACSGWAQDDETR